MRFKMITLIAFILLCSFPSAVNAKTYDWYFSDDATGNAAGNDSIGNGSITNPWKTLYKAQSQINSLSNIDTANLYFDRGDIWTEDTTQKKLSHFTVTPSGPVVNINAYGSGDRPCFEGNVKDFSTADPHNTTTGPLLWSRIFEFQRTDCSVSNIEIKEVYGNAIIVSGADRFVLRGCKIHHFGSAGLGVNMKYTVEDITVEHNEFYVGQQLWHYSLRSGWGAAIDLTTMHKLCNNNIIRYNLVYDIYGEGINGPNALIEYNIVGDTASVGINTSPHKWDSLNTTVRYNIVTMSDWDTSIYDNMHGGGSGPTGIRAFDEDPGGDNSGAHIEIYGNIVINRSMGIWFYNSKVPGNPFGAVKIYNNTVIDCHHGNFYIGNPEECYNGYIYNNLSILYDRTRSSHTNSNQLPHPNWTVEYNHFWTTGGAPSVGTGWYDNYITSDPKLPGATTVDWDGLTGPTYFHDINFSHLYPPSDSGTVSAGKALGSGFDSMHLTKGRDSLTLPDSLEFIKISQPDSGKWSTGAIIRQDKGSFLLPPDVLSVEIKN